MEEAVEWLKRCPNPGPGEWVIEARPVFETADFGEAADTGAAGNAAARRQNRGTGQALKRRSRWHMPC